MEEVLNKAMDVKLKERREYLDLIEETKEINFDLYLKMVQAEETRATALAQKGNADKTTSTSKFPGALKLPDILTDQGRPLRRAKSTRQRRVTKKYKATKEAVVEEPDKIAEPQMFLAIYNYILFAKKLRTYQISLKCSEILI